MHAMICTRPDLAQGSGIVSKYVANSGKEHWFAVSWILRYLKGTKSLGILFQKQENEARVLDYVDANYEGDFDKKKVLVGYVLVCGGGPIN